MLVPHNHRYWLEKGDRWEYFWISMNGEEALRIHKSILSVSGPVLRLQPATIDHLADCSLRLIKGAASPGAASAIAYEAAMALYDDVFGSHAFAEKQSAMQPVIDHINANLDKPLPVAELVQIVGLSRAHFSRCFAESEGMPPAEFVLQQRLQRAAKLLTKADFLPVKEVAILCGFEDANYFSKVFRRALRHQPDANSAPPACMPAWATAVRLIAHHPMRLPLAGSNRCSAAGSADSRTVSPGRTVLRPMTKTQTCWPANLT